jgi:hypothetical protein
MDDLVTITFERRVLPELVHGLHSRLMTQSNGQTNMAALRAAMDAVKAAIAEGETDGE